MTLRRPIAACCLLVLSLVSLHAAPTRAPFKATPLMSEETRMVIQFLEQVHYLNTPVSNATFEKLVTQFMSDLDEQRMFFNAADQQAFLANYGPALGTALREGKLDAAFAIFAVYHDRAIARVDWIAEELKKDFDFATQETFPLERKTAAWPATAEEADDLWRRRLKFELIPDLLNNKTPDEAKATVARRYERLRKNLDEIEAPEIEEIFLSTLTQLYDPHSTFFSAETLEDFSISMRLSLVGIGALLASEDGYCVIKELIPGGPAMLSKEIHVNDKIVAVAQLNEEAVDVIGMNLRKVVNMIRGQKGSPIALTIVPADASDSSVRRTVSLRRDVVQLNASRARASIHEVPEVDGAITPIGVIDVPSFYGPVDDGGSEDLSSASVTQDVEELLGKLKAAKVRGVVLDLRNNGGGLLGEAVDLTGLFIKRGPVVQVRDSYGAITVKPDVNPKIAYDGPLMVLTSRYSASASEIVAGALQNYGRAIIVGDSSTHGKGTVQAVLEMRTFIPRQIVTAGQPGAAKLTVQKFYLPNGFSTQNKGVIPDISLPAIEDFLPIGEADLPNSLPWDTVDAVRFTGLHQLNNEFRRLLRDATTARVDHLEEFNYLRKRIDWMRAREDMKEISLNLEQRRLLKQEDESFRADMKKEASTLAALNYPNRDVLLDSVANSEHPDAPTVDELLDNEADDDGPEFDVHLRESLRILCDAIRIAPDPVVWTDSQLTVAAHLPERESPALQTN